MGQRAAGLPALMTKAIALELVCHSSVIHTDSIIGGEVSDDQCHLAVFHTRCRRVHFR